MKGTQGRNGSGISEGPKDQRGTPGDGNIYPDDTDLSESGRFAEPGLVCSRIADTVLVLSADGTICDVLCQPDGLLDGSVPELRGSAIESFWPGEPAAMVIDSVKRVLRSRRIHSEEVEVGSRGVHHEFVFIAQGRDRVLVVVRDISEQKSAESRMKRLAYYDEVTGLPNREYLLKELDDLTGGLRLKEGRAALVCIDIDDLDMAESASGNYLHSEVLAELARRLREGLRGVNQSERMASERYSIVARLDYRQFGIVLPGIEDGSDALAVTERLSNSLQRPVEIDSRGVTVTVNAGIALFPQDGTDAVTLFENANKAANDARNSQTAAQKLHSGTAGMRALERLDTELELRAALDRDEFVLHYLPIVRSDSQEVVAAEALLRWPRSVFSSRPIAKLVSLAEYTGLIIPIGEWVLNSSCRQLREWHTAGHPELRLAVNLSAQEFSQNGLADRIAAILRANSIDARFLDIEITERLLIRDAMQDFASCRALTSLGIRVVIDDYGTGPCSFAHLAHSPVKAIKIDGSFIAHSEVNPDDRAACAAAIAMAHELSLEVVAEGVETGQQSTLLQELGCDFLQGFLFLEPAAANDFKDYLDSAATL